MTDLPKNFGGIPGYVLDTLIANGFDTVEKLNAASDSELTAIDGIGSGRVKLIRKAIDEVEAYADQKSERKFVWLRGWNWADGDDGFTYLNFKPGTEIKCLRKRKGSNELEISVSYPE